MEPLGLRGTGVKRAAAKRLSTHLPEDTQGCTFPHLACFTLAGCIGGRRGGGGGAGSWLGWPGGFGGPVGSESRQKQQMQW